MCSDASNPNPAALSASTASLSETTVPGALQVLVDNHRTFLAFLERRVGSRAIAEDVLQEAFVRGMDKLDMLQDRESAVAWFYRLLRNAVVDYHRRQAAKSRMVQAFAEELTAAEPDEQLEAVVCRCVAELAATLKPEYADAIQRIEVEGMPVKSYAELVGISGNNAAVRVFRAREALRKQVARSCGTCAEHGCVDCTCGSTSPCSPR